MKKKTIWISTAALGTALILSGAGVALATTGTVGGIGALVSSDRDDLTGSALEQASAAALAEVGSGTVTDAESSDDRDHAYEVEVLLDNGTEVDVKLDAAFAVVRVDAPEIADADDDGTTGSTVDDSDNRRDDGDSDDSDDSDSDDVPLTDAEASSASAAALAEVGSGTVTELDRDDDAGKAFEVEVTLADGSDVDVELDADFAVVSIDRS
jgi:uncharacterized membrane protein YkoI